MSEPSQVSLEHCSVCIARSMGATSLLLCIVNSYSSYMIIVMLIHVHVFGGYQDTHTRVLMRAQARDAMPGLRRCRTRPHNTVYGREQALHPPHKPQYTIFRSSLRGVHGLSILYMSYRIDLSLSHAIVVPRTAYTVHSTQQCVCVYRYSCRTLPQPVRQSVSFIFVLQFGTPYHLCAPLLLHSS
jgi:hypothetical protein